MFARVMAVLGAASVLTGQTPPVPASVAGILTNSVTGEPIVRGHVTLHCSSASHNPPSQTFGALTDEKGVFAIAPLPPGNCSIDANRIGFVAASPGGPRLDLSSGSRIEGIKLKLIPAGSLSGRVVDSSGDPAPGVSVSAEKGNRPVANATTDERGRFRIGGLQPGKYRVKATPHELPLPPEIREDGAREQHNAATYSMGSLDSKTAQIIDLKPGVEADGVNIRLVRAPVVLVSGKVNGIPVGVQNVAITARPSGRITPVGADGSFVIWRLDPGRHSLRAQYLGQTLVLSAPVEIEVMDSDLGHLELSMTPPFELRGRIQFADEQARESLQPQVGPGSGPGSASKEQPQVVMLFPLDNEPVGAFKARTSPDDSFLLQQVQPARYRVGVVGVAGFVSSLTVGDRETDGDVLDLRNGSPDALAISLSSNYCEVAGTVTDGTGPVAEARTVLESVTDPNQTQYMLSDSSGAYKFRVPPGNYRLAVVAESEGWNLDDYDTETLELRAGDKITKHLTRPK
jgi:hypothetical protein